LSFTRGWVVLLELLSARPLPVRDLLGETAESRVLRFVNVHILAKTNKKPIDGLKPGEIISGDPVGKISPASAAGYNYFFVFKDLATGYLHAIPAKTKDDFLSAFSKVHDFYSRHGWKPRILRTDGGKELISTNVEDYLISKLMTLET
jgi:hypothetical protein